MTFIFFKYPILKEQASDDLMARKKLPHGRSSHRVFGWSKGGGGKPEVLLSLALPLNGKEAKINSARDLSNISAPAHCYLIEGS